VSQSSVVYKAHFTRAPLASFQPEKSATRSTSADTWDQLLREVDQSAFVALDDRYGCPDCADQGGEWIEVRFADGNMKRVTFDYNRPPPELLEFVKKRQAVQQIFGDHPGVLGSAAPIPDKPTPR